MQPRLVATPGRASPGKGSIDVPVPAAPPRVLQAGGSMLVSMPAHNARTVSPLGQAVRMEDALETVRRELKTDIDSVRKEVADSAHASLELLRSRMSADLWLAREGLREQLREQLATGFAAGRDDLQETLREQLVEEIREGREAVREQLTGEVREARKLLADELQDAIRGAAPHLSKRPPGEGVAMTSQQLELHCQQLDESLLAERTARDTAVRTLRAEIVERLKSTNEMQDQRHERLVLGLQKTLEAATDHLESELNAKNAEAIETTLRRQLETPDFQIKIRSKLFDQERLVSLEQRFEESETRVSEQVQGLMQELAKHLEDEHEARVNSIVEIRAEIAQYAEVPMIAQRMRNYMDAQLYRSTALQGELAREAACTDVQVPGQGSAPMHVMPSVNARSA